MVENTEAKNDASSILTVREEKTAKAALCLEEDAAKKRRGMES
jgi:hypothetical protein